MSEPMENMTEPVENTPAVRTRKPRRKMTEEERKAFALKRQEAIEKARNLKPEVHIQYGDLDASMDAMIEAATAEFRKVKKRAAITSMRLYVKPEEATAYYVINDTFNGKISI